MYWLLNTSQLVFSFCFQVTSKMHSVQEIIKHKKSQPTAVIDLTTDACNIPSTSGLAAHMLIASEERAQVLDNVNKIMESELQCSICADLIIEATALNCSHTFCKHCIDTWKQKKKECPVCRLNPLIFSCKCLFFSCNVCLFLSPN